MKFILNSLVLVFMYSIGNAQSHQSWTQPDNPVELGQIHWLRNYDEAIKKSNESGLPILLLFQEVPGCSNCTTYGHKVLSHPFIVEMVETHFIPLAIFNNKGGHDKLILKRFKEPSWNNPVVRIINSNGNDLTSRLSSDFSSKGLAGKIKSALSLSGQVEPTYFSNWRKELESSNNVDEVYLSMYCFWTGEKEIAQLDGVLSTEAGFMHGREVVKVGYNNSITDLESLVEDARKVQCADEVYAKKDHQKPIIDKGLGKYRIDREVKYYLSKTKYKSIPMTPLQAAKVNATIGERNDPEGLLSPRQLALLSGNKTKESFINQDFTASWYKALGAFY